MAEFLWLVSFKRSTGILEVPVVNSTCRSQSAGNSHERGHAQAARQGAFDCGLDDCGTEERETERHSYLTIAAALASGN